MQIALAALEHHGCTSNSAPTPLKLVKRFCLCVDRVTLGKSKCMFAIAIAIGEAAWLLLHDLSSAHSHACIWPCRHLAEAHSCDD
jgi:hypothetical protein